MTRETAQARIERAFEDWWARHGQSIDPDTDDVPWFDKRKELCGYAFLAAFAQSGNYVADDSHEPHEVTFANGRVVRLNPDARFLEIESAAQVRDLDSEVANPRCPKCQFTMCEQFDERKINAVSSLAIPNGNYRCYHCSGVLAAAPVSRPEGTPRLSISEIRGGEDNSGPLDSIDLFLESRHFALLVNVLAGSTVTYSFNCAGVSKSGTINPAVPEETHRCSGCGHQWESATTTVELCGDCWRAAQPALICGSRPEGTPTDKLHDVIMNLACVVPIDVDERSYRIGHRDARHNAAEKAALTTMPFEEWLRYTPNWTVDPVAEGTIETPPALETIAREFIAYYAKRDDRGGGCSNCGGIPHTVTCFVGRFEAALAPAPDQSGERNGTR